MGKVAYSIAEAAASCAVTEATITEAIRGTALKARQAGSIKIILHTDLIAWTESLPSVD